VCILKLCLPRRDSCPLQILPERVGDDLLVILPPVLHQSFLYQFLKFCTLQNQLQQDHVFAVFTVFAALRRDYIALVDEVLDQIVNDDHVDLVLGAAQVGTMQESGPKKKRIQSDAVNLPQI
jgi:hypothetical protein